MRRTVTPELSADLTAETFAAALLALERFDRRRAPALARTFGIAQHKLLRPRGSAGARRTRRWRKLGMGVVELEDEQLERVARLGDDDRVDMLLRQLPPDQARAVRARVIDEQEYAQIARHVQTSESVIRQRVSRGLAMLRAIVKEREMTEIPAIERELLEAARRLIRPAPATCVAPVAAARPAPAAVALGLLTVTWGRGRCAPAADVERPAPSPAADPPYASPGGYVRQRELLGVERNRTAADGDRQVAAVVRGFRRNGPHAGAARLLGKAASGGAFRAGAGRALLGARFAPGRRRGTHASRRSPRETAPHAPRQPGRGRHLRSMQALLSGSLIGAIAGQSYGVVPDGVVAVRPTPPRAGSRPPQLRRLRLRALRRWGAVVLRGRDLQADPSAHRLDGRLSRPPRPGEKG